MAQPGIHTFGPAVSLFPNTVGTAPGMEDWQLQNLFGFWTAAHIDIPPQPGFFIVYLSSQELCLRRLFLYQYGFGVLFPVTVPADCRWGAVSPEKDVRSGSGQRRQFPGSVPYDIIKIPFHFCHFPPDLRE